MVSVTSQQPQQSKVHSPHTLDSTLGSTLGSSHSKTTNSTRESHKQSANKAGNRAKAKRRKQIYLQGQPPAQVQQKLGVWCVR